MISRVLQILALVLCLSHLPVRTSAFLRPTKSRKIQSQDESESSNVAARVFSEITFSTTLPGVSIGPKHGQLVLECEAQSIPAPTIHWLKNGVRVLQGESLSVEDDTATYEDHPLISKHKVLSISSTKSRLTLDCLSNSDHAVYTCVAETPYVKITQNTTVKVVKREYPVLKELDECMGRKSRKGEPANIFMWTLSRLEYEDVKVQLFCRAEGFPTPSISWYDRDNQPIEDDDQYELLENGDLMIRDISWFTNMGVYTCVADNGIGTDTKTSFLYPAARD